MITCAKCRQEVTAEQQYVILDYVDRQEHMCYEAIHRNCINSQAGETPIGDGCLRPASKEQENG